MKDVKFKKQTKIFTSILFSQNQNEWIQRYMIPLSKFKTIISPELRTPDIAAEEYKSLVNNRGIKV